MSTIIKTFEHPSHKGLIVEQLWYGKDADNRQDIRYRVKGEKKIMKADDFFNKYGSTIALCGK